MNLIHSKINENLARDARQRRSIRDFDRYLTGGLLVIAATAAALPWYVFFNPEKFGISGNGWEALKHVPQRQGGGVTAVAPHFDKDTPPDNKADTVALQLDPLTTATLPTGGTGESQTDSGPSQPFPGGTRFKLLHVSNGRALIEDKSGMFLVQIGSALPDDSRLVSMNSVDGKWQIITSSGEVYSE
ncbi:hypothetical protein GGQ73_000695 [Rhizobium skierniewicense]|uniref:Flagellar protein n=1 Tax=Rhizobium skierniewicense TaxID=984260 RepID=A0A7W6C2Y4_9HYPH|nr:flagellar protein [Rhizobium skierniewicense]MBB3944770.1 hypothetical protein [Rhizobium skierniewicense]